MYAPPPPIRSKRRMFWTGWFMGMLVGAACAVLLLYLLGGDIGMAAVGAGLGASLSISAILNPQRFEEPHRVLFVLQILAVMGFIPVLLASGIDRWENTFIAMVLTQLGEISGGVLGVWLHKRGAE